MEKKNNNFERRIEHLKTIKKLEHQKLSESIKNAHDRSIKIIDHQIQEYEKNLFENKIELSKQVAEFRAKYSKEINAATISDPNFISHFIHRHADGWFDEEKFNKIKDAKHTHEIIETFLKGDREIYDPDIYILIAAYIKPDRQLPQLPPPWLINCPSIFYVGEYYTIVGFWLGNEGEIYFDDFVNYPGLRIDTTVTAWGSNSISFFIPEDTEGVPFNAHGKLYLVRSDGQQISLEVTVEPISDLFFKLYHFSDEGMVIEKDFTPFSYEYEKIKTFTSPPLPDSYKLLDSAALIVPGLELYSWDNSYYEWPSDSGSNVELISGPYQENNKLYVKIRIEDDWHWDYTVRVQFCISVPQGFNVDNEWYTD